MKELGGSASPNPANGTGGNGWASMPSRFERLLYLASRRNGRPIANGVDWMDDPERVCDLPGEHQDSFEEWLSLSLQEKQDDLRICAAGLGRSTHSLLLHWIQRQYYEDLMPPNALRVQRDLFIQDLELLFMLV